MTAIRGVNRLLLLAAAPFLGIMIWLLSSSFEVAVPTAAPLPLAQTKLSVRAQTADIGRQLTKAGADSAAIKAAIEKVYKLYESTSRDTAALLKQAAAQVSRPAAVFDARVAGLLGKPIRQAGTDAIDLKLYAFHDGLYQGYALKADLKSDKAMKMVLGRDRIGGSETTLSAASRYGAAAGVNAGGFADDSRGRFPTGTTMLNGKYVYGFFPSENGLSFVGLSADRKLIGGTFARQEELDRKQPAFGASFVPVLLQNGRKLDLPAKWLSEPARAARTVVGRFKNEQLLFIVTDGVDERGGSGSTLPELQDILLRLGVADAYNLDGGGSSTLVFDGQAINRPSDGRMRQLPTHFLFFK